MVPKGSFLDHAARLFGGAVAGQLIAVGASPILTRIYSPEDLGVLATFLSVFALVSVISSLKYEIAIPVSDSDAEVRLLVRLCLGLLILCAVATYVAASIYVEQVASDPVSAQVQYLPGTLSFCVISSGIYVILQNVALRRQEINKLAFSKVVQAVGVVTVQIGGAFLGAPALIFGVIAGNVAACYALRASDLQAAVAGRDSIHRIWALAKVRRRFAIFTAPAGLVSTIGMATPALYLGSVFGVAVAGQYMLAQRTTSAPAAAVSQAVAKIFFGRMAGALRRGGETVDVAQVHRILVLVCAPAVILAMEFSPAVFRWTFGTRWTVAGEMAGWLSIAVAGSFITAPISSTFVVSDRQGLGLCLQVFISVSRILALVAGGVYGYMEAILAYSCGSFVGYAVYSWFVFRVSERLSRYFFYNMLIGLFVAFCSMAILYALSFFADPVSLAGCVALYAAYLFFVWKFASRGRGFA